MAALIWLVIPLIAAIGASVWGTWASRRRTATPDTVGVAGYEAFREAMERRPGMPAAAETAAPERPVGRVPAAAGDAPAPESR